MPSMPRGGRQRACTCAAGPRSALLKAPALARSNPPKGAVHGATDLQGAPRPPCLAPPAYPCVAMWQLGGLALALRWPCAGRGRAACSLSLSILLLSPPGPNRYCALWRIGTARCPGALSAVDLSLPAVACPPSTAHRRFQTGLPTTAAPKEPHVSNPCAATTAGLSPQKHLLCCPLQTTCALASRTRCPDLQGCRAATHRTNHSAPRGPTPSQTGLPSPRLAPQVTCDCHPMPCPRPAMKPDVCYRCPSTEVLHLPTLRGVG